MNPMILNETLYMFDWASMDLSKDSAPEKVITDIAKCARQNWGLPLQDNGLVITHVEPGNQASHWWPEATIQGKAESMIRFVYAYMHGGSADYGSIPMDRIPITDVIDDYGHGQSLIDGITAVQPEHGRYRTISLDGGDVYVEGIGDGR